MKSSHGHQGKKRGGVSGAAKDVSHKNMERELKKGGSRERPTYDKRRRKGQVRGKEA